MTGSTPGTRDPFITYNPETETYYIIATDLRVFNANDPSWNNGNWGAWASQGSTMMNVWESKDLITWSNVRQIDVSLDSNDNTAAYLGMMWAPEATWVDDYYGEGQGAFVVYWSSNVYSDAAHTQSDGGSDIMWGATTDFTQDTWEFGGVMLDGGQAGCIDTNILQDGGRTYHITKSQASGEEIIMEYTDEKEWWLVGSDRDSNYQWTRVQTAIGADWYGAVEGPASFKDHSVDNRWYLFVDDLPTPGYQPMVSTDLDSGWDHLDTSNYFLTSYTKHGGVISLTKAQYDAIRNADATSAVNTELGTVEITAGSTADELQAQLPQTAEVNLAYDMGTSELPVVWDLSSVNLDEADTYTVTGIVQSISANADDWVGDGGSTLHTAANKELYSSRAIEVTAQVNVTTPAEPTEPEGNVTDLTLESAPAKLEYVQGEELDLTGLVMNALYENGYTDQIQAADGGFEVSGYDAQQIGKQTVTVSFGGQSVTFTVTVSEKEEPGAEFTGITIANLPDKTEYVQGEELDLTGIIVEAHYSDTSVVKLEEGENGYTVSGYDAQQIGEQTITVSYNGDSATFTVTVTAKEEPEDPQKPSNPEDTKDPDGTQKPSNPDGNGQINSGDEGQKAVQTGDTTNVILPLAGMGAAVLLAAAARRRSMK